MKTELAASILSGLALDLGLGWVDHEVALEVYEAAKSLPEESPARAAATRAGVQPPRPDGFSTNLLVAGGDP